MRDTLNSHCILSDVLANLAIASGGGSYKHPIFVGQRNRESIDFRFTQIGSWADPFSPSQKTFRVKDIVQAHHLLTMNYWIEYAARTRPDLGC